MVVGTAQGISPTPQYIGVKVVHAYPMDENTHREEMGHDLPVTNRDGYRVIYEGGYKSWSPKAEFEEAYREVREGYASFGLAIEAMRKGFKVARKGWNGVGMFLQIQEPDEHSANNLPYIYITIPQDGDDFNRVPWLASQTDMLSDDWFIVD